MHFEFLTEDVSGKEALEILLPKLIPNDSSFNVHAYRGVGRVPKNLKGRADPRHRILLDQLPRLLRGYAKTFEAYPDDYRAAVVVVCDLDHKVLANFLQELNSLLSACVPSPNAKFCIAIEEGEAWFLGDQPALKLAYPQLKQKVLQDYVQDSICGTWETLADAVHPGGRAELQRQPWYVIGQQKSVWARSISPFMNVNENASPSFNHLCTTIQTLLDEH